MVILSVSRAKDGSIRLALPLWIRIFNALVALLIAAAMLYSSGASVMSVVILVVAVLLALYDERFAFDAGKARLFSSVGFPIVSARRSYAFADVQLVSVSPYMRGSTLSGGELRESIMQSSASEKLADRARLRRVSWRLAVSFSGGDRIVVDTNPHARHADIVALGEDIATLCKKPFAEE